MSSPCDCDFMCFYVSCVYDSYNKQDECDHLTAVAKKQTLGRQVVSTLPVKHILLLQHLLEPPSPVSTTRPMWLISGRISHEAVYAGRRRPLHAGCT